MTSGDANFMRGTLILPPEDEFLSKRFLGVRNSAYGNAAASGVATRTFGKIRTSEHSSKLVVMRSTSVLHVGCCC